MSDQEQKFREIIARAWKDESFKQRLLSDPKKVLGEAGITLPSNARVNVHVDTADTMNFVLPRNPSESELTDEALNGVAGGSGGGDTCFQTCGQNTCYMSPTCLNPT
jgi:hypothetical protein